MPTAVLRRRRVRIVTDGMLSMILRLDIAEQDHRGSAGCGVTFRRPGGRGISPTRGSGRMPSAAGDHDDRAVKDGLFRPLAVVVIEGLHDVVPPGRQAADGRKPAVCRQGDLLRLGARTGNVVLRQLNRALPRDDLKARRDQV